MLMLCKAFHKLPSEIRREPAYELLQMLAIAGEGKPED